MEDRHPRPRFRHEEWLDLCGAGQFAFDDDDNGIAQRFPSLDLLRRCCCMSALSIHRNDRTVKHLDPLASV